MNSLKRSREQSVECADQSKKKLKNESLVTISSPCPDQISTTWDALMYLKNIFPTHGVYRHHIPPIMWKSQLYALIENRTDVDRTLQAMLEKGEIRTFLMGSTFGTKDAAIVFLSDYENVVRKQMKGPVVDKFMRILASTTENRIQKDELKEEHLLNEANIRDLIQKGLLAMHRTVGSYLFSIPNCGEYAKDFACGKRLLLQFIRKSKFRECLQSELENRPLGRDNRLPVQYYVLEIIGSNSVECIKSPTGVILRHPK